MKSFALKLLFSFGFINMSIPILETLPTELQPNSEIVKLVILPIVTAVLIPFFQRLLDRILPPRKVDKIK